METDKTFIQKILSDRRILFLIFFAVIVFVSLVLLPLISYFTRSNDQTDVPKPPAKGQYKEARELEKYSGLQQAIVGQTTVDDLTNEATVLSTTRLSDGRVKYEISSELVGRKNEIITDNGTVVFEAAPIFTNKYGPLPYMAQYIIDNGKPEKIITGNKRWDWFTSAYIYPSQGRMFIANTYTSEIYEVIEFTPMTLTEFERQYPEYVESIGPEDNPHN